METKICTKCKEKKTFDFFTKKSKIKDTLRSVCKECCKKSYREYYKKNPDTCTKYRRENPGYASLQSKKYVEKYPEKRILMQRKQRDNLPDWYIKDQLKVIGFNSNQITDELIEVKRLIIKTKRLWKTSQN